MKWPQVKYTALAGEAANGGSVVLSSPFHPRVFYSRGPVNVSVSVKLLSIQ